MRQVNMLPDGHQGSTTAFFRALDDADDLVFAREERDEALCRCDELEAVIGQVKQLHLKTPASMVRPWDLCSACGVQWPCPTMKLIGA